MLFEGAMENLLKGSLAQSQLQHWWPSYLRTGPFPRWLKRPPRGGTCLPLSSIVKMRSTSLWLWIFCMERHKVWLVYKIQRSGYLLAICNKRIFTCVIYIFCLHNEIKFKNEFVELMYIGSPPYGLCRNFFDDLGYVSWGSKDCIVLITYIILKNGVQLC